MNVVRCILLSFCSALVAGGLFADDQFFQSDGVRIRYIVAGRGEPVVLVHGWAGTTDTWKPLMTDLSRDHEVIAFDCRGHGKSDKPHDPAAYGLNMADDVLRLMDHLRLRRAHIIGYSMGAGIVAKLLADHPDRFITAVLGANAGVRKEDQWDSPLVKDLETGMLLSEALIANRPAGTPEPSPEQREMMRRADAMQDSRALAAARRGNSGLAITDDDLRRNKVPVLVVCGALDHPEKFDRLHGIFANAEFAVVEGAGHTAGPPAPAFVRDVREFLSRHPESGSR